MPRFFFIIAAFVLVTGCHKPDITNKVHVITTIFPLFDFAKEVGQSQIDVSLLIPPGVEAHSFEPTPQDIIKINESDIFIYIGEVLEPWVHDLLTSIQTERHRVIEASQGIALLTLEEDEHSEEEQHGNRDPHIWLDFELAQKIVNRIADTLSEKDPAHKDFYMINARIYNEKLLSLDQKYKATIEKCSLKTILYGGHFVFGYLAKRYGLTHISPYDSFSPDSEPTPQKIAALIDKIKTNKLEYLFYEELLEPKVANLIAKETEVKLELLHGAHNITKEELSNNITYLQIMEENLEKLKKGLKYN